MELLEPIGCVGDEEVANLVAAEVEDEGAPVGVLAKVGVGVLIQVGAVKGSQRPRILGEVGGDPVEQDTNARLVQGVDQEA